jgi:hypothetical protein
MSSAECHADGAKGSVPAKAQGRSPTSETPTAPGPSSRFVALSLSLHVLMFLAGLARRERHRSAFDLVSGALAAGIGAPAEPQMAEPIPARVSAGAQEEV